jgi:ABC-type dipeptide/oligopeptide/nickel transport system permease subunit
MSPGELLYGARFSLLVAFLSASLSTGIRVDLGVIVGCYNRLGFTIMRVVDLFLALPRCPLIVFMAALLRPGFWTLVLFFLAFEYADIFVSDVWLWWAFPRELFITLVVLALAFTGFSLEEWANPEWAPPGKRNGQPGTANRVKNVRGKTLNACL